MKAKPRRATNPANRKLIKVRLDYRTIITLTKKSALASWRKRFPQAKIMPA